MWSTSKASGHLWDLRGLVESYRPAHEAKASTPCTTAGFTIGSWMISTFTYINIYVYTYRNLAVKEAPVRHVPSNGCVEQVGERGQGNVRYGEMGSPERETFTNKSYCRLESDTKRGPRPAPPALDVRAG